MNTTQNTQNQSYTYLKKEKTKSFLFGLLVGGAVVACVKDDSDTIKEIGSVVTKIATSYYGCKFIYSLFT